MITDSLWFDTIAALGNPIIRTPTLDRLGVDTETLGEVMAIVGLFNQTNALANGYQIQPDVFPPSIEKA